MDQNEWIKNLPAEIVVCDTLGVLCEMNVEAELLFKSDGGRGLLESNMLDCHPDPYRGKLERLMDEQKTNAYFNTASGKKRFFYQAPWQVDGTYSGYVEISFEVPEESPHFTRG